MREPERTPEHKKDPDTEDAIAQINATLAPLEEEWLTGFQQPSHNTLFIVGAPRSGTTLLAQALADSGAFDYVSNFTARFWQAPFVGMRLEEALGIRDADGIAYTSNVGVTPGWAGPHEFGYFWERWFAFGETHAVPRERLDQVDTDRLVREIAAMQSLREKPFFFKNLTCSLQIPFLASHVPGSVFLHCTRDPLFTMQSILQTRQSVHGDHDAWFSLRPRTYPSLAKLPVPDQIAGQVRDSRRTIQQAGEALEAHRFGTVRYEDLCRDPRATVERLTRDLVGASTPLAGIAQLPDSFEPSDDVRISDDAFEELERAWAASSSRERPDARGD